MSKIILLKNLEIELEEKDVKIGEMEDDLLKTKRK